MELSWLQNLNLLLSRTVSAVSQANDWTTKISKEVKYTLLCLADRRKSLRSTTAMHYFDVRMLIHDVNLVESDEPANLQNGFTRHFFVDQSSNNESDAPPPSCDNHYGASSSTATKRKATDDPSSSASMPQSGRRESRLDRPVK
ncbi:hypothetical protein FOTG_12126 [Fusarium oxysporum f. sp. vasinfectum 25433]|uniref:Uncharacterized protein n=1 Tax=Fusarium oxysporum f. sp. vasinfectum 25433 TaxID=1089449 RepID=X0L237_FUSOX|nr:hypothetical protein FOTG_12126 [Fusarium oxysporum f. sp. vasinfectum 25433]